MATKQNPALLISGDEPSFVEGTLKFQEFLVKEVGFDPSNIRVIFCTYMGNQYIKEETQMFFDALRKQGNITDVVLYYNGMGGKGLFWPNLSSLSYDEWGRLINHDGNFIFINDSCYSGSLIPSFKEIGLLPKRGLVLASSQSDEPSYRNRFSERLMQSLRNRKPFREKVIGEYTKYDGKIMINVSKTEILGLPQEGDVIDDSVYSGHVAGGYKEKYVHYRKPKIIQEKPFQHPSRSGRNLDYILMPER